MEENKKYTGMSDGGVTIKINKSSELTLPGEINIGDFREETTQLVSKEGVPKLIEFIEKQLSDATTQRTGLEKQMVQIEHVKEDMIDDKLLAEIAKSVDKGSKSMKSKLPALEKYLNDSGKKKQLKQQLSYINKQIKTMEEDLAEIKKSAKIM